MDAVLTKAPAGRIAVFSESNVTGDLFRRPQLPVSSAEPTFHFISLHFTSHAQRYEFHFISTIAKLLALCHSPEEVPPGIWLEKQSQEPAALQALVVVTEIAANFPKYVIHVHEVF